MRRSLLIGLLLLGLLPGAGCTSINPDVTDFVRNRMPGLNLLDLGQDCICAILCWGNGGLPCGVLIATLCGFEEFPGCFNSVNSLERVDETTGKELTDNLTDLVDKALREKIRDNIDCDSAMGGSCV